MSLEAWGPEVNPCLFQMKVLALLLSSSICLSTVSRMDAVEKTIGNALIAAFLTLEGMKREKEPAGEAEACEVQMPPGFAQLSPVYTA